MDIGAGFVVRSNKGNYLVCHPTNNKDWSFPKGMAEPGESLFQTAKRELKEETGFTLVFLAEPKEFYGVSQYKHNKKKIFFYLLDGVEEFEPICESYVTGKDFLEIDEFAWVSPRIARKLLHYSQKHLVE